MAIVTNLPRKVNILSESFEANGNLTALENCAVAMSGGATGRVQIAAPGGQGLLTIGILQTASLTDGLMGDVLMEGICQAKANGAFNSGIELTVADTTGELAAAGSGDYVIALALEASSAADAIVTVKVVSPYQKN